MMMEFETEKLAGPMMLEMILRKFVMKLIMKIDRIHNIHLFDQEIEVKIIRDDISNSFCERYLQEKMEVNEEIREFEEIFDNRYIENDRDNNQMMNIPYGNNLMKVNFLYDDNDDSYKLLIEISLLESNRRYGYVEIVI